MVKYFCVCAVSFRRNLSFPLYQKARYCAMNLQKLKEIVDQLSVIPSKTENYAPRTFS